MPGFWKRFIRREGAATAIEYALIAVGISIGIVGVAFLIGDNLDAQYSDVEQSFK